MWLKGVTVWLGAALIGAFGTTAIVNRYYGTLNSLRWYLGFSLITLLFTVCGSAFLFFAYSAIKRLSARSLLASLLTLATGTTVATVPFWLTGTGLVSLAALYGLVTSGAWLLLLIVTKFDRPA